ncbi:hypothetical protein E4U16_006659, partial [Claviceps sp. LM84 group G4]
MPQSFLQTKLLVTKPSFSYNLASITTRPIQRSLAPSKSHCLKCFPNPTINDASKETEVEQNPSLDGAHRGTRSQNKRIGEQMRLDSFSLDSQPTLDEQL